MSRKEINTVVGIFIIALFSILFTTIFLLVINNAASDLETKSNETGEINETNDNYIDDSDGDVDYQTSDSGNMTTSDKMLEESVINE